MTYCFLQYWEYSFLYHCYLFIDDIQIVFEEKKGKKIIWTDNGKFLPHDVHRKCAISFKTPPYKDPNIRENVSCFIYLRRPSDNSIGKRREFTLIPLKGKLIKKY